LADDSTTNRFVINLPTQTIAVGTGRFRFEISPLLKRMLLEGLDPVGVTLSEREAIEGFERGYLARRPWLQIA
jgi:3-isopropylmalate/(R)-2-methylmalate dehydratase small subunit